MQCYIKVNGLLQILVICFKPNLHNHKSQNFSVTKYIAYGFNSSFAQSKIISLLEIRISKNSKRSRAYLANKLINEPILHMCAQWTFVPSTICMFCLMVSLWKRFVWVNTFLEYF